MKSYTLAVSILAIAILTLAVVLVFKPIYQSLGSVSETSEYRGKVVDATNVGTSTLGLFPTTLGSVIISSTSPVATAGPAIAFYDTSSTTKATTSMTAFASLGTEGGVTPTVGTYTFDVHASSGLQVWIDPSFNGNYTITYR